MNITILNALLLAALSVPSSYAGEAHQHAREVSQIQEVQVTGVVTKVDFQRSKITLRHGDIPQMQMPAMVMNYQVVNTSQLAGLQKGDRVNFVMSKVEGKFVVTHIEPAD